MKELTEENLEGCHKDARKIRLTKARLTDPASNLMDIISR